ncbi:DUF6597 domain-containing transcriptional factor [Belliella marina]|uniref:DUF6597 domain-containing transcriptional factor n=1 Tax=Belliella marina TaxID=1644146 RepID=A0ABW4VFW3_9BACT
MEELKAIKGYYRPIQPTVKVDNGDIVYREVRPGKDVENLIYCYWQLTAVKPLEKPFIYRVVSDGCIDIFFNHHQLDENYIMGFCRKYTEFQIGKEFNYVGIRFLPAAFPLLFGLDAKRLSNQSQELKAVLPKFSKWIETNLSTDDSLDNVTFQIDNMLAEIIQNKDFEIDGRFFNSLKLIFQNKGLLDTEKDLMMGLSPRQLRRVFDFYIGTTPKAFSNVVRFQYILNAKPSTQSLKENKLYLDVGFFDQAHFIKNFKTFYGVTPSKAFQ